MEDSNITRNTIPDWGKSKAVAFVYPYKIQEREHLKIFYDKLLAYIPEEIDIILLVKDLSFTDAYLQKCIKAGIKNKIDFFYFPDLFDIWVRDYAPLTTTGKMIHFPVKFVYAPKYVEEKYEKYIGFDNEAGHLLGEKYINKGEHSIYFKWDMGNLSHNGAGTAIISNRLITDNENTSIDHELKFLLKIVLGFANIIFIPTEPDDETGHVDGMVRFISEKVVVVGAYPNHSVNHNFMETLTNNLKKDLGDDYAVIRLLNAEPEEYISEGIGSAVGNHMNFLRLNDLILFPYYNDQISKQPLQDFKSELERHKLNIKVIAVDMPEINDLARKGGVLNCISWQNFS